ncbi:hypothetical protein HYFRA_00010430 [Hymenoscyphus fraxineus]|uniref:Uncharacterized protein n=1 Tax=Hymenoscyphus fraxineus TaxID=746836 RepID=A0A9N9L1V3_9HELO|nr:hypothetical protein HYFRA_00010430 [Hymenoscyphus fraxineus]
MIPRLPIELRNKIYIYSIANTPISPFSHRCHCHKGGPLGNHERIQHTPHFDAWSSKELSLLLVNKQTNKEVLDLTSSTPNIAWPHFKNESESMTLPIHYQKSSCEAWYDLTIDCQNKESSRGPTTIEQLVEYISEFKILTNLEIVLHIPPSVAWEVPEDHQLSRLLPLLDISGIQTRVRIEVQVDCEELDSRFEELGEESNGADDGSSHPAQSTHTRQIMGRWIRAWEDCQEDANRAVSRKDLSSANLVEFRDFQKQIVVVTVFG